MLLVLNLLFGVFFAFAANAQSSHIKKTAETFVEVYRDTLNGLSWSSAPYATMTNGCATSANHEDNNLCTLVELDEQLYIKPKDSEAARYCSSMGARLPTKVEFESLIRNFEFTEEKKGPQLTSKGRDDMKAIFNDTDGLGEFYDLGFWSSFVHDRLWDGNAMKFDAYAFIPAYGNIFNRKSRRGDYLGGQFVRCVRATEISPTL